MAYLKYDIFTPISGSRSGASSWSQGRRIRRTGGMKGKGSFYVWVEIEPSINELIKKYDVLRDDLRDMRPAWDMLIPQLRREMGRHIMSQGAAVGETWPQLKDSYADHKSKLGDSRRRHGRAMLVLTGKLLQKLTTRGVMGKSKTRLKFGIRAPGARALHFGSPQQGIAKRPYMVATAHIQELARKAVAKRIEDVCDKFGINRYTGRRTGPAVELAMGKAT